MLIAIAVFFGVVGVVFGAYLMAASQEDSKLLERLQPKTDAAGAPSGVLKKEEVRHSSIGAINRALQRSSAASPLQEFLEQAGLHMNVSSFLLFSGCLGLAVYVVTALVTGMLLLALLVGVVASVLPCLYGRARRTRRLRKFEDHFPEAIDLIARALRAGHALTTGLGMVADEVPAPVGTEFRTIYDEQNFGLTLVDALRNFASRVPLVDARFFVTAVLTQRESGGNLAEVLDNLSEVIRDRFKVKRQVRVISAHGRITGVILSALPPCLAAAIMFISPGHLMVMVHDPLGHEMIYSAIIMQIVGTLVIRKLCGIEY